MILSIYTPLFILTFIRIMSFGAGHIQDMNNRIKQNRDMKSSRKSRTEENDTHYPENPTLLQFQEISDEELYYLKIEIRKKALRRKRLQNSILTGIGLAALAGILWLVFALN